MRNEKSNLRVKMKDIVASLSTEYMRGADALITENILGWEHYQNAETIFMYITMASEIDTMTFMAHAMNSGKKVYAPKCYSDGTMEARMITGLADMEPGYVGISEPKKTCPVIKKNEIDLILVPCLSADKYGNRLGYGGGFYDRYLKDYEGTSVVLCREKLMSEKIPLEEFDVPAGYIVTEEALAKSLDISL